MKRLISLFALLFAFTASAVDSMNDFQIPNRGNGGIIYFNPKDSGGTAKRMLDIDPTNGISGSGFTGYNYILNGNLDFWQRGAPTIGVSNNIYTYTTDHVFVWQNSGGTVNFTRSVTSPDSAASSVRANFVLPSTKMVRFNFPIESSSVYNLMGKTVTFSLQMRASTSSGSISTGVKLYRPATSDTHLASAQAGTLVQVGSTVGVTPGTGSFSKITATFSNLPAADVAKGLLVQVEVLQFGGTTPIVDIYVSQAMLNEGSTAAPFKRTSESIGGELALLQRYYVNLLIPASCLIWSATEVRFNFVFPVALRRTPVVGDFAASSTVNIAFGGTTANSSSSTISLNEAIATTANISMTYSGLSSYIGYACYQNYAGDGTVFSVNAEL